MRRHIGRFLMAIGILHSGVTIASTAPALAAIAQDGFFNAVFPHLERGVAFWSLMMGAILFALGSLTHWAYQQTGMIPATLGWILLTIALVGALLVPVGGFWLVIALALWILIGAAPRSRLPG